MTKDWGLQNFNEPCRAADFRRRKRVQNRLTPVV